MSQNFKDVIVDGAAAALAVGAAQLYSDLLFEVVATFIVYVAIRGSYLIKDRVRTSAFLNN